MRSSIIILCCILSVVKVPFLLVTAQVYSSDEELQGPSGMGPSGFGTDDNIDINYGIKYKRIEIKFSTKHNFQNSPSSRDFMAEVVELLTYVLNDKGGPLPDEPHRPAMVTMREISLEGSTTISSRSSSKNKREKRVTAADADVVEIHKFKGYISVPASVDVREYLEKLQTNSQFFESIKQVKPNSQSLFKITEADLIQFEDSRLRPIRLPGVVDDNFMSGTTDHGVQIDSSGDHSSDNGPNKPISIDVRYQPFPDLLHDPVTLAAMIAGALAGLVCTILCTIFVVYRMRKKDEGSYALDEPKNTYKYKHEMYIASATKEFFA